MNETTPGQTTRPSSGFQDEVMTAGNQVVDTAKSLIHKGNVRSIVVRRNGRTIAEFPLTAGLIGAVLAPQIALLGLFAALFTQCSIEIVYHEDINPQA